MATATLLTPELLDSAATLAGSRIVVFLSHFKTTKRGSPENHLRKWIRATARAVYIPRRERTVHPEGDFDSKGRWYPCTRESGGGSGTTCRAPSKRWPYSYMLRCRTREHCENLVRRWLDGYPVPDDVERACLDGLTAFNQE